MRKIYFLILANALFFSACSLLAPRLKTPDTSFSPSTPNPQSEAACKECDSNISFDRQWWKLFKSAELDALVDEALKNSTDLRLAFVSLERAGASLGISRSNLLPKLDAQGSFNRAKSSENATNRPSTLGNSYAMSLNLSYELDLWGKYRDDFLAKNKAYEASVYDFETARLSLVSNVAKLYFNAINLNNQVQILAQSVADYEKNYELKSELFKVGAISEYELASFKAQLDSARASLESTKLAKDSNDKALAALTSNKLDDILYKKFAPKALESYDINLPSGISSEILLLRPDIGASLKSLEEKNYLIGAARAQFLPSISLTGLLGFSSTALNNLTENPSSVWSVGGAALMPIFRWGEIAYNVDLAKLSKDEAFLNYESTLKTALGEVRTALIATETAFKNEQNYKNLLESQGKIYELSQLRYDAGTISLTDLITAKNNYLNAKLGYENAVYTKLSAIVDTIKAFGGGFKRDKDFDKNLKEDTGKLDLSFQ